MLILDAAAVRAAFPYDEAIRSMRDAMIAAARGEVYQPLRFVVDPPTVPGIAVLKPAAVAGSTPSFGFKSVTLFPGNQARGLAAVQGFVALLDPETGVPQTLLEGGTVTEIRTAAVSAVATDALARSGSTTLAIIGAGVQGRAHLDAIRHVRPVERVQIWNRTRRRAEELAEWATDAGLRADVADSPRAAVAGADVVCTTTTSAEPLVDGDWLADGVHINAVGAFQPTTRELFGNVVAGATVVVDSRESALAEAGDLLLVVKDGLAEEPPIAADLGEVLLGTHPGRTSDGERTIYESLGLALQDVAAAAHIDRVARQRGVGVDVRFP